MLTFNFGLIDNQQYFSQPSKDLFLRYPHTTSFNSKSLQLILARSLNRISLRLLNTNYFKKIKSIDLLKIETNRDLKKLESIISKNDITLVRGFVHEQKYSIFRDIFFKIRGYLSILESNNALVQEPFQKLKGCDLIVGIAIRHGDYKQWQNGEYFLPAQTYQKWMNEIESLFSPKKIGFFIASDEEQDLTIFRNLTFFFRAGHPLSNLYSLSKCDFLASVPSSFAGWAHFIGEVPLLTVDKKVRKLSVREFKSW